MWAQYIFFSPDYLPRWPPIFMLHKLFLLYSSDVGLRQSILASVTRLDDFLKVFTTNFLIKLARKIGTP